MANLLNYNISCSSFFIDDASSQSLQCSLFGLSSLVPQHSRCSFMDSRVYVRASLQCSTVKSSVWNEKPYILTISGKKMYFDERDVVGFLDPPLQLLPFAPHSYNAAAYLWKKIDDIPADRRPRLLELLKPKLVSNAWKIAETRFYDTNVVKERETGFLHNLLNEGTMLEFWTCRMSGGPFSIAWIKSFRKALFRCNDGRIFGRFIGLGRVAEFASSFFPLYFSVEHVDKIMSTEEPCDIAFELGEGTHDIHDYPPSFPKPGKHPWPLGDHVVVYVRFIGPGVALGQVWREGSDPKQVPRLLSPQILLMIKDPPSLTPL